MASVFFDHAFSSPLGGLFLARSSYSDSRFSLSSLSPLPPVTLARRLFGPPAWASFITSPMLLASAAYTVRPAATKAASASAATVSRFRMKIPSRKHDRLLRPHFGGERVPTTDGPRPGSIRARREFAAMITG